MGMLDKGTLEPVTKTKPLQFATDRDIDAVLNEMDETKQPFDRPEIKDDPRFL